VKWDGYRAMIVKDGARVRLISRNLKDLTSAYPHVAAAAARLTDGSLIVDGEIVAIGEDGLPSFQALQHRSVARTAVVFYAFDLLRLGATDYRNTPLAERRRALQSLTFGAPILLSAPLPGSLTAIERAVRKAGLEGVVAKRSNSVYEPGRRSRAWIKVKFSRQQELVIGGFKPGGTTGFDSVLVGYYDGAQFLFAGKVRAGFTARTRQDVWQRIANLETPTCPFRNLPNSTGKSHWGEGITAEDMKSLRWVKPRIVVHVAFTEWTAGGNLRHASFAGIRDDKPARAVKREVV
jgi:bifunctional non-homologous end joining protein LigD